MKKFGYIVAILALLLFAGVFVAGCGEKEAGTSAEGGPAITQKGCPVCGAATLMPALGSVQYEGREIYFDSPECMAAFKSDPEAYAENLGK